MTISSRRGGAAAEFRAARAERAVAAGGTGELLAAGERPSGALITHHPEARYFSA